MEDQVAEVINIGGQNEGTDQHQVKTFLTLGPTKLLISRWKPEKSASSVCQTGESTDEVHATARRLRLALIPLVAASIRPKQLSRTDSPALVLGRKPESGLQTSLAAWQKEAHHSQQKEPGPVRLEEVFRSKESLNSRLGGRLQTQSKRHQLGKGKALR